MGNSNVKHHYENATRTGVFQLKKANLNEFPKDIQKLKSTVRSIDLSDNKIKIIPSFVGDFTSLKRLSINNNSIGDIPIEISHLKKLETLSLSYNCITSISNSIIALSNLRNVHLSGNHLTSFPLVLASLKNVEYLDLSKNKITSIPDNIDKLQAYELNMNQNQISHISKDIASAPRLKILRLQENCITLNAFPIKILTDSQISLLTIEGNLFEMKAFYALEGYDHYLERFTATKKKFM